MCRVGDWRIDLSGRAAVACDPHGWFYSFNFQALPYTGRTNGRHPMPCVRRRRWVRAHVPDHWPPSDPVLVAALHPNTAVPAMTVQYRRQQSAPVPELAGKGASRSVPCPQPESAGTMRAAQTVSPGERLPSVGLQGAVLRGAASAAGVRGGAALAGAAEKTRSPADSEGLTCSPCSPRSPHAKLDLRSVAPSEELGAVLVVDDRRVGRVKHQRTHSAPHVLHKGTLLSDGEEENGRRRSFGGDSCSGHGDVLSRETLGRKVSSFPVAARAEDIVGSADDADGVDLGVVQDAQDPIEELLRSWSQKLVGGV